TGADGGALRDDAPLRDRILGDGRHRQWLARTRDGGDRRRERRMNMSTVEHRVVPTSAFESAGPFTAELFEAVRPIWDAQLEHPFVKGIGDGSLEVERFKNWVRQDYVYLREYSRMFAWAVTKALDLETMGWYARMLDLHLNMEMGLHRKYAERFGISLEELEAEEMWPTNRAYTDFLIRTSADGDLADLTAALLPCAWGYAYVGQNLARAGAAPEDQRYADWIA